MADSHVPDRTPRATQITLTKVGRHDPPCQGIRCRLLRLRCLAKLHSSIGDEENPCAACLRRHLFELRVEDSVSRQSADTAIDNVGVSHCQTDSPVVWPEVQVGAGVHRSALAAADSPWHLNRIGQHGATFPRPVIILTREPLIGLSLKGHL